MPFPTAAEAWQALQDKGVDTYGIDGGSDRSGGDDDTSDDNDRRQRQTTTKTDKAGKLTARAVALTTR